MRIYELAKKWGIDNKELVTRLKAMGYKIKNHMSTLDDEVIERVEAKVFPEKAKAKSKPEASKPAAAPAKPKETEVKKEAPVKESAVAPKRPSPTTGPGPGKPAPYPSAPHPESFKPAAAAAPIRKPDAPEVKERPPISIEYPITVAALSKLTDISATTLIKTLISVGVFANMNQLLSEEIVAKISGPLGLKFAKLPTKEEEALKSLNEKEKAEHLVPRPPVVTIMGHVDHGKTSLLDAIRKTNVVDQEAGRITQHIGAYGVDVLGKGHVTFLDTPGHEAFSAMRARGANVTDVVVLVVAADDGVMPQTIEAINHAKAAGVPIVVAVNKCDLPNVNPDQIKIQLQQYDLVPEDWGGKTIFVNVSARTGKGVDQLLELLLLEAEILELKANPNRKAAGAVVESRLSKGRGSVATVLVQQGTLNIGDAMVCGLYYGKIRAMHNDHGKTVKTAGPSHAVEILGLNGVPEAGDNFFIAADEQAAREISEKRQMEKREKNLSGQAGKHLTLYSLHDKIKTGQIQELKIIIKADVKGSAEALTIQLEKISTPKMRLRVIHAAVGGINESDVMLAAASDAIIIGFHVKADPRVEPIIEREQIDVRFYSIIYEAIDDAKKAMEGLLAPTLKEVVLGYVEVRQIFKASKIGTIAGCHVMKGKMIRNAKARLIRDNIIIYEGRLSSLKRFKDDMKEVAEGYDCGLSFENFNDIKVGDRIEAHRIEETKTTL